MHEMIQRLADWYSQSLQSGGYPLIVLLMAIESSIFPLPSELVIPPAAYLAHARGGMSVAGVVAAGAIGSWLGATAMYGISRLCGRPLVIRYGRFILISSEKVEQAERWSARFGGYGVFASRMLPVIRHLIGIPAGIVRIPYLKYSAYTLAGSAVWCAVLSWVGIAAGNDPKLMSGDVRAVTLWSGGAVLVLGGLYYFFVHRHMRPAPIEAPSPAGKAPR
jgi:membrane protein DedA with SNARE-associated domain